MNPINPTQKITPFLWFNDNAEEAMNFYASVFKNARVVSVSRNDDGSVFTGRFEIEGQEFMALNGGPHFTFTPAISFFVDCKTQEEVDYFWEKLSEDGEKSHCGWLKDKFGVSWQIVPSALGELLHGTDPVKSKRVMDAMMKMTKIEIEGLQRAYDRA